jgi:hypothetical protein
METVRGIGVSLLAAINFAAVGEAAEDPIGVTSAEDAAARGTRHETSRRNRQLCRERVAACTPSHAGRRKCEFSLFFHDGIPHWKSR